MLTPKQRFRLNRLLNYWEQRKADLRQTKQAVLATQKMCPSCRALVGRDLGQCPYCGQRLKIFAASPTGKMLARAVPDNLPATGLVILANLVMFAVEYIASGTSLLTNLMASPSPAATLRLGESLPLGYVVVTHQYWRWVTACFLHAGLIHIGMNMWALYYVGPMVESFYGRAKFVVAYFATGAIGFAVSSFFGLSSLGASGAIYGLFGLVIAYGRRRKHTLVGQQLRGLATWLIIYAVALTFMFPGVDNFAHLGGGIAGFLLGLMIRDDIPQPGSETSRWNVTAGIVLAVSALCFVLMALHPVQLG